MSNVAQQDFDWIDDAFDDKKTAEDMERAKSPGLIIILFLLVVIAAVGLIIFAIVGIAGSI